DLEHAVMRMLEKEPEHRWPSMQHALAELKAAPVFEGDPVHRALVQLAVPSVMTRWDDIAGSRASKRGTQRPASHAPPTPARDEGVIASEPEPALAPPTFVTAVAIQVPVRTIHVGDVFSLSASAQDSAGGAVRDARFAWAIDDGNIANVDQERGVV